MHPISVRHHTRGFRISRSLQGALSSPPRRIPFLAAGVLLVVLSVLPSRSLAQSVPPVRLASVSVPARFASLPRTSASVSRVPPPAIPGMLIPVVGVTRDMLRDSYHAARSGGRIHHAIDIPAPRGTPVVAVEDGEIVKVEDGKLGGHCIFQLGEDGRVRYYYAHLDRFVEGIRKGSVVRRGEVIGYVGDTGNAQPGDYHLHFAVQRLDQPRRWWEGHALNPFLVLRGLQPRVP